MDVESISKSDISRAILTEHPKRITFATMVDRDRRLNVRVSEAELKMVYELAEERGLAQADVVRLLVREAYDAHQEKKKRRPKP